MKNFTRIFGVLVLVATLSINTNAQSAFEEDAVYISAGYGVGTFTKTIFDAYSSGYSGYTFKSRGPFFAKVGIASSERVEFGLNFAYSGATVQYDASPSVVGKIDWTAMSLMGRLNIHFGNSERFDPYWGIGFGYRASSWKFSYSDSNFQEDESIKSVIPLAFETTFGARYLVTKNLGVYAEFGLAKAMLQFGLTAKL